VDILLFMTWKTLGSLASISETAADGLIELLPGLALTENARVLEAAVVATHVHTVLRTQATPDIPRIAQRLKGASARLLNRQLEPTEQLHWARGYDVRTVGRQSLPTIRAYFDRQASKHRLLWVRRYSAEQTQLEHAC
jgi:REP element-mobilizing transposase RayT